MRLLASILLLGSFVFAQSQPSSHPQSNAQSNAANDQMALRPMTPDAGQQRIVKEVRHELLMLPYYSIFDDLEYSVNGGTVTLLGSVVDPVTKSDAERSVKKIEGVEQVNNQIKVLPPSPMDDQIRRRTARAIFNSDGLFRYSMGAVPPIHIIVDNGHVTLKGFVDNQGDKDRANIAANQVPGVFSVTNDLQVSNQSMAKK
jgi:hyperosmotically inducible periplasmic protein